MSASFLYPYYIILFLAGFYLFWTDKKRQQRLKNLLVASRDDNDLSAEMLADRDISSVEKVLRKSSKVITISSLFDKNIVAKTLVVGFVAAALILLNLLKITNLDSSMLGLLIMFTMVAVILLPDMIKKKAIAARIKRLSNDLPFVIDMMAVCVQSGMTIEKSLRYLADNTSNINRDIAVLFDRAMIKSEVSGIASALDLLYEEVPSVEIRMFCSTLQQSIKYGSSVYEVLLVLSKEIREMQLLQTEEKISSLAAKMTIPMILLIMMPILAMVAGPGLIRMVGLWSD